MEISALNKDMLNDVKTSVNVTRGEFEQLLYEVKANRKMIDQLLAYRDHKYNVPDKVSFILEVARMLNLSIGDVKEL